MQDITEKKFNQSEIELMAFYDTLTMLPNRALLNDRLNLALEHSKRFEKYGAVLFLDLDNFKTLNDSYGHQAGDDLLAIVAQRIQSVIRKDDTVARFGGDEFVIVLNELDSEPVKAAIKAQRLAQSIRHSINQKINIKISNTASEIDYFITASVGIAMFDPVMQEKLDYSTRLDKELRQSLKQNDFVLYYQPQYDAKQNLVSAEALIRWSHPELGLVNLGDFIKVAEESNLILPIGDWVLSEACQQLKKWQSDPQYQHLSLSVNISAKQIWQKDFVVRVKRIVSDSGINVSKLKLEITESILLRDINGTAEKLNDLVAFGLTFSLDDFGTGYSSLGYLKNLPIDEIKIDQSFIRDLFNNKTDLIMIKSIIDLGKNFGINVVAEGVETEAHFEILKEFGCDIYQGYYFSRPVPVSEFATLI